MDQISLFHRWCRDRRGGTATFFALVAMPLLALAGGSVEYARVTDAKTLLQNAVDSAAIAAWQATSTQRSTVGTNSFNAAIGGSTAMVQQAQVSWATNADGSLTGNASASYATSFLGMLGISTIAIHASATVTGSGSPGSACLLALDPSSSQSLLVNSNVTINAPSCEIDVASTGSPAAIFNANDTFNLPRICVAGSNVTQNGGAVTTLKTSCATPADPFAATMPSVSVGPCTVSNQNYAANNTLFPGVYCGTFNFNGTGSLTLSPGLYILSGANWNLNSGWTVSGAGVTFYFADSSSYIQANSGVTLNLSAPTSGTYSGILMFEPAGLAKSSYTINGSAGHALSGLIYQPSRNITFNSQSNLASENLTIVVNQAILDSLTWNLAPASKYVVTAAGSSSSGGAPRLIR